MAIPPEFSPLERNGCREADALTDHVSFRGQEARQWPRDQGLPSVLGDQGLTTWDGLGHSGVKSVPSSPREQDLLQGSQLIHTQQVNTSFVLP